jgi:subtilisin family serine protease
MSALLSASLIAAAAGSAAAASLASDAARYAAGSAGSSKSMQIGVVDTNPPVRVRLERTNMAEAEQILGRVLDPIEYAHAVDVLVSPSDAERLIDAGVATSVRQINTELTLGDVTFDLADGAPAIPAGLLAPQPADGEGSLWLIQLAGPTQDAWLDAMTDAGLEVVRYISPHAYVVWGTSDQHQQAVALLGGAARASVPFHPAFKVRTPHRDLGEGERRVTVLVARAADPQRVRDDIASLGVRAADPQPIDGSLAILEVRAAGTLPVDIARVPGVFAVQPTPTDGGSRGELTNQIVARNLDASDVAFPGYGAWLSSIGVDGSGVIIAAVDDGMDDDHPDLINNVLPCVGSTCGGMMQLNHGTHTAGIIAADGSTGAQINGFLRGQGVAPGAGLVEIYYPGVFLQPGGVGLLMTESVRNGAVISSNSWGTSGNALGYDAGALQVDVGVRDADPALAGEQALAYVLAIDNGSGGFRSIGSPDEAKNAITVGSTVAQSGTGAQNPNFQDISFNSAHGPTTDGRTVPLIVAPGCSVDSTGLSSLHIFDCGTSMAAPHVTGVAALFVERFRQERSGADPSPALIKAALLAGADSLAGNLDADGNVLGVVPDDKQGWGLVNAEAVVGGPWDELRVFDEALVFDQTGESWSVNITPADPLRPVRIMLVWTDAPGHGLGGATPAWNNDLDLSVAVGPDTYLGNNIGPSGFSVTGGSADGANNAEGVILPGSISGATITVSAADINSDGVPAFGDATDQDFALVVLNAQAPATVALSGDDTARVCGPADAVYQIDVTPSGGFTGNLVLNAWGLPAGASFVASPNPVNVGPGGATVQATVTGTGALASGDYAFDIVTVAGGEVVSRTLSLAVDAGPPIAVNAVSPAAGASGVAIRPTFTWDPMPRAIGYQIQVDEGLSVSASPVIDETIAATETAFTPAAPLAGITQHTWRVRAVNTCGPGAWSSPRSFTTAVTPDVLLVDDDDNSPDVRSAYTNALDALGVTYDVWDTDNSDDEPSAAVLSSYRLVIWFTGDEFGGFAGPSPQSEAALGLYLDGGGCLLISSQDYLFDRGGGVNVDQPTPFMAQYLGAAQASDSDVEHANVTGQGTLFSGIGPFTLQYPFSNFSDEIVPDATAELAFSGNEGDAGIVKITETYTAVYLGFPFEAFPTATVRRNVLERMTARCTPPCPGDADGDRVVGTSDLLLLLSTWGGPGAGDLNGSGIAGTDDLLLLLTFWGQDCND